MMKPLRPAIAVLVLAGPAAAQPFCDASLRARLQSPLSYQLRGDRCEGIYAQQVSAPVLEVRSLVAGFEPFDPARDPEVFLSWTPPPGATGEVRLRALSFRPGTYFRMDTAVPAAEGSYRWPADVLAQVGLAREELGLVAWVTPSGEGATPRELYLPLRAGPRRGPVAGADYEVSVVPSQRLADLRITVERLGSAGAEGITLRQDEELGYGYYPSNKPTVFSLGRLAGEGIYRLKISARPHGGAPGGKLAGALDLDFYHPGD